MPRSRIDRDLAGHLGSQDRDLVAKPLLQSSFISLNALVQCSLDRGSGQFIIHSIKALFKNNIASS